MAHILRKRIANKFVTLAPGLMADSPGWIEVVSLLPWGLKFHPNEHKPSLKKLRDRADSDRMSNAIEMTLPYKYVAEICTKCGHRQDIDTITKWARETVIPELSQDEMFHDVFAHKLRLEFELNKKLLFQEILQEIVRNESYGFDSEYHKFFTTLLNEVTEPKKNQTILVEYSSPNIAKPFHAGHLRSTIHGNVISNLYTKLGHRVVRINYLGNWGTQFGLLAVGYERYGKAEELEKNALRYLLDIYVDINKKVDSDPSIMEEAKAFNVRMEQGDEKALALWRTIMEKSLHEYIKAYKRLGIEFDKYEGEADQVEPAKRMIQHLKDVDLLHTKDGLGYVDLTENNTVLPTHANVVHSDGTTFYLTRDITAAIERYEKYNFDRLLYIVAAGQEDHFSKLFCILTKLGYTWASIGHREFHIPFGRIRNMSSRKGTSVLLEDLLDHAKAKMIENMNNSENTRWSENMEEKAEILGQSAIIIYDLRSTRIKNYNFDWDKMTSNKGQTGVTLQYAHARLYSLEQNCGLDLDINCDVSSLVEQEAIDLVILLAKYDEAINEAISNLEAYKIVQYLFLLQRFSSIAINELRVKGEPDVNKAKARLLLFHCTRSVFASGLKTLGLTPLNSF